MLAGAQVEDHPFRTHHRDLPQHGDVARQQVLDLVEHGEPAAPPGDTPAADDVDRQQPVAADLPQRRSRVPAGERARGSG